MRTFNHDQQLAGARSLIKFDRTLKSIDHDQLSRSIQEVLQSRDISSVVGAIDGGREQWGGVGKAAARDGCVERQRMVRCERLGTIAVCSRLVVFVLIGSEVVVLHKNHNTPTNRSEEQARQEAHRWPVSLLSLFAAAPLTSSSSSVLRFLRRPCVAAIGAAAARSPNPAGFSQSDASESDSSSGARGRLTRAGRADAGADAAAAEASAGSRGTGFR